MSPVLVLFLIHGGKVTAKKSDFSYVSDGKCHVEVKTPTFWNPQKIELKLVPCRLLGMKSGEEFEVSNTFDSLVTAMKEY